MRRLCCSYSRVLALLVVSALGACSTSDRESGADESSEEEGATAQEAGDDEEATIADDDGGATGTASDDGEGEEEGSDDAAGEEESSGSGSTDGTGSDEMVMCGDKIYACGDGLDNDGDGFFDLKDPECISPCDDDEGSFATGIPGDNRDCKQDCFFDGDSGSGNDGCNWDLRCDPANPGEGGMCEYRPSNSCDESAMPTEECLESCLPNVPNGCDCFGCCTVTKGDGTQVNVFLGSANCSVDNLDACTSCTLSDDCDNPCEPGKCEICIGETVVPDGCPDGDDTGGDSEGDSGGDTGGDSCDGKEPCDVQDDCPQDYYCFQNCCFPPVG